VNGQYRTARVEHLCTHCNLPIPVGVKYWCERVTPWDHPENERYFSYKAHAKCRELWNEIGGDYDWEFFDDHHEWRQALKDRRG